ncbi:MAG: metallophosphoesterase family protein [Candidatus Ornithospirochaeta sp.]
MKRSIPFLLSLLLLSSCIVPDGIFSSFSSNPFLEPRATITSSSPTFVFFTDAHIGRDRIRDDVEYYNENFYSFLDAGHYAAVVSGGDMADDGEVSERLLDFLHGIQSTSSGSSLYLETIGNHDRHEYNYKAEDMEGFWYNSVFGMDLHATYADKIEEGLGIYTTGRYLIRTPEGDLSIYILDTSTRSFSSVQLMWLEEALERDAAPFKIMVSHCNIVTGGEADHSTILTGMGDEGETARFLDIVDKAKVSLVLTGHHHKGNILYGGNGGYCEFNGASYHSTGSLFESKSWWYTVTLGDQYITIDGYDGATMEVEKTWRVKAKL